jgi:hypothetical protein
MGSWDKVRAALAEDIEADKQGMLPPASPEETALLEKLRGGAGDPMSAPIALGVKAKHAVDRFIDRATPSITQMPLRAAGKAMADLAIPQSGGDLAVMPFAEIRGAMGKPLTEAEREAAKAAGLSREEVMPGFMRQNAVEAVREAKKKANMTDRLTTGDLKTEAWGGPLKDEEHAKLWGENRPLGQGIDMRAYDKDGVVVKSPRFLPGMKGIWDGTADPRVAKRTEAIIESSANNAQTRAARKEILSEAGLAPEAFYVETPRKAPYLVVDKAEKTLQDANLPPNQRRSIEQELHSRAYDEAMLEPDDLIANPGNVGRYGDKWKIIDTGHFEDGTSPDDLSPWRRIRAQLRRP